MWLHSRELLDDVVIEDIEEMCRDLQSTDFQYIDSVLPLHRASSLALEELTQLLVSEGADPNKTSIMGTPLECALRSRSADDPEEEAILHVVSILLESNADIHLSSRVRNGKTLLTLAAEAENPNLFKLIVDTGVKIDMSCLKIISDVRFTSPALRASLKCISYEDVPASIKPLFMDIALNFESTTEKRLGILENSPQLFQRMLKSWISRSQTQRSTDSWMRL